MHLVSHSPAIRYSRYTDVHHSNQVKSDKIEITNKSDQKTRNHVSPLIKQDVSSVPKEKMADTLLSLETRGREEYLHKELLFAGEFSNRCVHVF